VARQLGFGLVGGFIIAWTSEHSDGVERDAGEKSALDAPGISGKDTQK